ncbi:MAG TPA: APC family permease [Solirubrobacteraceae bacterium]|nr:APC family permease [Solirubrobacteraceae bacterium]
MPKTANWWSAFVIGLAGTILVTGIGPTMVTSLGAAAIPVIFLITACGWLLCMFLAELAAMMPERAGGLPSYIYPALKDKWPRGAKHLGAFGAWGYWLGWFPVAPLNMILASFYMVDLFHLSTKGFTPIDTPIAWWTLAISVVGILLLFIPSYLGLRFGASFATVLAMFAMIPMTFLAISWIFHPSVAHFSWLFTFRHTDGTGFFAGQFGHNWWTIYLAFAFLLTWNVLAMEAAACYIGECKDPRRDAKIALNLEGGYGLFIYTMIPVAFIIVLGTKTLGNSALVDPKTIFVGFASKVLGGGGGSTLNWIIAWMLIIALVLSALNAITGTARSLHQMSADGNFPRFFSKLNRHGVPSGGMLFTVGASIAVVFMGGAVQIYTFSNVGYLIIMIPVLYAYYHLRQTRPNLPRPVRLPEPMKYVALALAAFFLVIYVYGGPIYASCKCSQAGKSTLPYYFMGFGVLALYLPFYWYRHHIEDKRGGQGESAGGGTGDPAIPAGGAVTAAEAMS